MSKEQLEALLERLEKAEGPDREIDGLIWSSVHDFVFVMWDGAGCVYKRSPEDGISHVAGSLVDKYTASLDAAVALVEKVLPGWHWCAQKRPDTAIGYINNNELSFSGLFAAPNPKKRWYEERHPTSPVIALLKSLISAILEEQNAK